MHPSTIEPARRDDAPGADDDLETSRWHEIVCALGAEIASPLTAAVERISALATTGRIDRHSLRALRDEVETARQLGMAGQQLARLAAGHVRQSAERTDLAQMLAGVLAHRARSIQARGVTVQALPAAKPVEILIDAPLLFSLLGTLLDWALACARSNIALRIDVKPWPTHARLACRFAHRPVDQLDDGAPTPGEVSRLDSMHWRLLAQTARTLGVAVDRGIDAAGTVLTLEFPRTVNEAMEGLSIVELDDGVSPALAARQLAGSHVLVIARQSELRTQVRDALRNMGLLVDCVGSVAQAADFCRDGLPHAVVVESRLRDERFAALRRDIAAEVPQLAFIEIVGDDADAGRAGADGMIRVAASAIAQALPAALLFELSSPG